MYQENVNTQGTGVREAGSSQSLKTVTNQMVALFPGFCPIISLGKRR
jgi:hypothetical protein